MRKTESPEITIPVHSLAQADLPVSIHEIQHQNPYDFTREHRHDYFEILIFNTGGGSQLIDFIEYPVKDFSSYIVFPRQVHLLKRHEKANGLLIQFREEAIPSAQVKSLLRQVSFGENPAVIFEHDENRMKSFHQQLHSINEICLGKSVFAKEIVLHYLQALLFQMIEQLPVSLNKQVLGERILLFDFQKKLDDEFASEHVVQHYVSSLGTTEKKLSATTKKHIGLSPLQVIHERLLLEAKRLLLFENASLKEIAFQLGFDSAASFSHFIRNKTGLTPSELSIQLVQIHK